MLHSMFVPRKSITRIVDMVFLQKELGQRIETWQAKHQRKRKH